MKKRGMIALFRRFWKMNEEEPFGTSEVAVYMYLLYRWWRSGQPAGLVLPNRKVLLELDVKVGTLVRARNELHRRGVLEYRKAESHQPAAYVLVGFGGADAECDDDDDDESCR